MNRRELLFRSAAMVVATGSGHLPASAAAPLARTGSPEYLRLDLNGTQVTALLDGTLAIPLDQLYRNVQPDRVVSELKAAFLDNPTELSVNAYVINTGSRLVLIDAGTGSMLGDTLGNLPRALIAAGYQPDQVDDIILTHVHTDHSGGLVANGRRVFPNATVHANKREVEHWLSAQELARAPEASKRWFREAETALGPYIAAGRLRTFADNADPVEGFRSQWLPGHTPGHSAIIIQRGDKKLSFWGDVAHGDVIQFDDPKVTIEFDLDQAQAMKSREVAFADAASGRYWVAGAHLAFPGVGHVRADSVGYDWAPMNYSAKGTL